jgi:hypothetical protein
VIGVLEGEEDLPDDFLAWLDDRSAGAGVAFVKNGKGQRRAVRTDGGCSAPTGDTGRFFNFRNPCKTHDLGYDLTRFFDSTGPNGSIRKAVDNLFFNDMKAHCSTRAVSIKPTCAGLARTYYQVVAVNSKRQGYGVP